MFASAAALLAGCSQDMTEDLAPVQVAGKSTIYATYANAQADGATRSHATPDYNENGSVAGFSVIWDQGDALGLFNYDVAGDDTNIRFGYTTGDDKTAAFTGDHEFLSGEAYVGYYPYSDSEEAVIDNEGKLSLKIKAKQDYRYNGGGEGSFAAGAAPAVAYGPASETDEIEMTFYGVATYLRVPICGDGDITSLKLKIKQGEKYLPLTGTVKVDIADIKKAYDEESAAALVVDNSAITSGSENDEIVLNFGKGNKVSLKDTPTWFWFVIPADMVFNKEVVEIYINEDETPTLTREFDYTNRKAARNITMTVWEDSDLKTPFEWIEGAAEAVKIEKPEDFLKYAYLATKGKVYDPNQKKGEAVPTDEEVGKFYTENGELRPAIFMKDINFTGFAVETEHSRYVGGGADGEEAYNAFEEAVYYWWYHAINKDAISTIGDANCKIAYSIDGRGFSLIDLNVKGNGLFHDTFKSANEVVASNVKNLVLDGVTVYAGDAEEAYFLTNRLYPSYKEGKSQGVAFTNVTVNENCALVADKAAAAKRTALVGTAYTGDFEDWMNEEVENKTNLPFIDKLAVIEDVNLTEYEKKFYNIIAIHAQGEGAIVTVADAAEAHELIKKIEYLPATNKGVWYSVVDKKENYSYWTGWTPAEDKYLARQKDVVTAEMLAYYVQNGTSPITLTNNIDLGYGKNYSTNAAISGFADGKVRAWETQNNAIEVDGKGFTIRQATVTTGLFGAEATVNDLKVNAAFVDGGYLLAKTGTAEKVTASGLTYTSATPIDGVLAGLFYEADIETAAETTDCTVTLTEGSVDPATICNFGYLYGVLGIDLSGSDDDVYKIAAPAKDSYGAFKCFESEPCVNENGKGSTTYVVFTGDITELPQAEETIIWGTPTPEKGHTIFFCTEKDYVPGKVYGNGIVFDGNVTFTSDVTVDSSLTIAGDAEYDLGGNTINATGGTRNTVEITSGNVTIKNGTINVDKTAENPTAVRINGTEKVNVTLENVTIDDVSEYPMIWANNENATVTIKSGEYAAYEDSCHVVYVTAGKVIIEGGTFGKAGVKNDWVLNLQDDIRKGTSDKAAAILEHLEVRGGTFINFNPADNKCEGEGTSFVPAGYQVEIQVKGDDTYYTVVAK